jgi:DNA (cytosine-5)-methyltransferase 1
MGTRGFHDKNSVRLTPIPAIDCVDVFCGVGGLTHGLIKAGVQVSAGIDIDPDCRFAYESNNPSRFIEENVASLTGRAVKAFYATEAVRLLAGCAPCQPFSTYSQGRNPKESADWAMLLHFGRLIREVKPELITMENVPQLADQDIFDEFIGGLKGYHFSYGIVDCAEYGLPQNRRRLVLLASKFGPIELLSPHQVGAKRKTVRATIGKMPPLSAGEADPQDPLHVAAGMSELNLRRIRASKAGGTWRDWPKHLRAACHNKASGDGYGAVYGRMAWDKPAPTMTTLCHGFGNGRFGHPDQDRGISLREAAMLQTFPKRYKFVPPTDRVRFTTVGRMVGNAVPPKLGEVIGRSLLMHAAIYEKRGRS